MINDAKPCEDETEADLIAQSHFEEALEYSLVQADETQEAEWFMEYLNDAGYNFSKLTPSFSGENKQIH